MTTKTLTAWQNLTAQLRERREAAAARRALEADLARYTTPSDIEDLLAAVDRQSGPEAEQIRGILTDNLIAYHNRTRLVA